MKSDKNKKTKIKEGKKPETTVAVGELKDTDHRTIGRELELFTFDDRVGKGLPLWLPKGTIIKNEIEKFAIEMEDKYGYDRVSTPHIGKQELFETSGHLPYYADSMYPAMKMDDGTYYLKAMNCPHHHVIYGSKPRSYRELPVRLAEYGTVYRNELSGTLAGLLRVRVLTMNDAHIYCTREQVEEEFKNVMKLTMEYLHIFGFHDYWFRLSKWDPKNKDKYIDEPDNWDYAEEALRKILKELKVKFVEADNEAAFYGPKVDVQFKAVNGREETMSTIQLDFVAKKRFNLTYKDKDGKDNNEVFVIHRAPLSTHERFIAFMIENYAGNLPLWLSPVQVAVIPVMEKHEKEAEKMLAQLKDAGIRAEYFPAKDNLGKRIRDAKNKKIPAWIVVGDKEIADEKVTLEKRSGTKDAPEKLGKVIENIKKEIQEKK